MLHRWNDSQRYLSDNPDLVCEETANYLVIMCIDLEVEEVKSTKLQFNFQFIFQFIGPDEAVKYSCHTKKCSISFFCL